MIERNRLVLADVRAHLERAIAEGLWDRPGGGYFISIGDKLGCYAALLAGRWSLDAGVVKASEAAERRLLADLGLDGQGRK